MADAETRRAPLVPRTRLRMPARRRVRGLTAGDHPSIHRARSLDHDDLRPYERGDDVRDVDWKASARSGQLLLRHHVADHRQRVLLAVDTGLEMQARAAGGERKAELAVRVAALAGAAASESGDLVGLLGVDADRVERTPLRIGRAHVEGLAATLARRLGGGRAPADVPALLRAAARAGPHRQLVVIVTDEGPFLAEDVGLATALRSLRRRHDVLWVEISDTDLLDPGLEDRDVVDAVTGLRLAAALRADPALAAEYRTQMAAARQRRVALLGRLAVPFAAVASSGEVYGAMAALLERARRA